MSLIDKAVEIAKNNPNCFIGYFAPTQHQISDIFSQTKYDGSFTGHYSRSSFLFENGAQIVFGTQDEDSLLGFLSGAQLTHAFVDAYLWEIDSKHWQYIMGRVRHPELKKFTGVGVYDKLGKYCWED